jgi:type II secretory pathway pseudopilin PulG
VGDTGLTHFSYTDWFDNFVSHSGTPQVWQMFMKSRRTNVKRRRHGASGFSLVELVVVVAISIVVTVVSVISLVPMMNTQHVANAYNTTLAAMRQARDNAVAQRTSYSVTFSNSGTPNTITVSPTLAGFQGDQNTAIYQLPPDVSFVTSSAISSAPTPDGYGTGANAIDFGYTANGTGTGGQSTIYFCPDGSAQDAEGGAGNCLGSWDGGVVYLARSGDVLSSRAVSLWGGTGRIHGWRLYPATGTGVYQWLRQ